MPSHAYIQPTLPTRLFYPANASTEAPCSAQYPMPVYLTRCHNPALHSPLSATKSIYSAQYYMPIFSPLSPTRHFYSAHFASPSHPYIQLNIPCLYSAHQTSPTQKPSRLTKPRRAAQILQTVAQHFPRANKHRRSVERSTIPQLHNLNTKLQSEEHKTWADV